MPAQLYDWQLGNTQGAVILGDAGISLGQLSSGSYQKMLDALEAGSSFSFHKNDNGKFDVLTDTKKDFWGNLINGSTSDFLGSLNNGLKGQVEKTDPDSAQGSFWKNILGKYGTTIAQAIGGNYAGAISTGVPTASADKADEWNKKYGPVFIRVAIGVVGVALLIIGIVFMFRSEATKIVVGTVKGK